MDKYPNKGMNALAKEKPEVAKKIMGYAPGGSVVAEEMTPAQKAMDKNNDGIVSPKEEKEYLEMMKSEENDLRSKGAKPVKKYRYGGEVKKYAHGGMHCEHRPDGIRGGGCAQGGMKFTGVK